MSYLSSSSSRNSDLLRRWGLIVLIMAWSSPSREVGAHPNHGPAWGERYLKLEISSEGARVVYGLTFSARYGIKVRRMADEDRDGVITTSESEHFGARFIEGLERDVRFDVDESRRHLSFSSPFVAGLESPRGRGPVALESAAKLSLNPGSRRFVLTDASEFEGIYRTTAKLVVSDDVKMIRCGRGPRPARKELRLVFLDLPEEGAPPPRIITAEVELPRDAVILSPHLLMWIVICTVGVLLTVATGFVVKSRMKR